MNILYIGGNGQISFDCVHESVRQGHQVAVFNRGHHNQGLPPEVETLTGDMNVPADYQALAGRDWDVLCQFRAFSPETVQNDLSLFTGRVGQYLFISSASAYQKPPPQQWITEEVPLDNPYWEYSRLKADCEALLTGQGDLPYTIVRPSHTVRTKPPTALGEGGTAAQRMLQGKPILVPGDGTALWTLTHARDFAPPFVRLLGNPRALGQALHLTGPHAYRWDAIYQALGRALGVGAIELVHVAGDTLVRYHPDWIGGLLGDKGWTTQFDNTRIKQIVGDFACPIELDELMARVVQTWRAEGGQDEPPDEPLNALMDRIIADQRRLPPPGPG